MGHKSDFYSSAEVEPHRQRTKEILKQHPEIRELVGRNPYTFLAILGIAGLQICMAYLLKDQSLWLAVLFAYIVGAFANHALFVLIHEGTHDMIFKRRFFNLLAVILCDLPNTFPSGISFRRYHLKHHSFQGVYDLDADLPNKWEARLLGNTAIGKAIWLLFFPLFQALRPPRLREIKFSSVWTWTNVLFVFGFDVLIFMIWGPNALLYLFLSLVFSIGLHPLGARWIQEHYVVSPPQETYSYYGPLNLLAFNVGHHNEHHDFPSVPWNRLPLIRKYASSYYDSLVYHTSWTKLLFRFLFDKNISLFSRVEREERAGLKVVVDA